MKKKYTARRRLAGHAVALAIGATAGVIYYYKKDVIKSFLEEVLRPVPERGPDSPGAGGAPTRSDATPAEADIIIDRTVEEPVNDDGGEDTAHGD